METLIHYCMKGRSYQHHQRTQCSQADRALNDQGRTTPRIGDDLRSVKDQRATEKARGQRLIWKDPLEFDQEPL